MADAGEFVRDTARRLPRFRFVVGVVSVVLVLQFLVSAASGVLARQDAEHAAHDMMQYLGDATITRTISFVQPARTSVDQIVDTFERGRAPATRDELAKRLYETMHLHSQVDALFVAFPDGDFVHVRRLANGYETRVFEGGINPTTGRSLRSLSYVVRSYQADAVPYFDPRLEPWYATARSADAPVWTDPYLLPTTQLPGVTTARVARDEDGRLLAVVGADIEINELSSFLDTLPLGDRGEAFIVADDGLVVAAPTAYEGAIAEALENGEEGQVSVDAAVLGVAVPMLVTGPDGSGVAHDNADGLVAMSAAFPESSTVPWQLHMRTPTSSLSPGLRAFEVTSLWGTLAVAILVLAASFFIYQLRQPIDELHERASTDDLTRLANRYEFRRRGQVVVDDAYERAEPVCVAMFDLDDFKIVNDTEGHAAGDRALRAAADSLRDATGPDDVVARFGGDEFVVVRLVGADAVPHQTVERIREHMERGINRRRRSGEPLGVTAGYALSGPDYRTLRALSQAADAALVAGKRVTKGHTHGAVSVEETTADEAPRSRPR